MTTVKDLEEWLLQTADKCIDRAIRWIIALMGIVFFSLLYLVLSIPMALCRYCENFHARKEK